MTGALAAQLLPQAAGSQDHKEDVDMDLKKIVVPLDGSPLAEIALDSAGQMAKDHGGTVVLMRAVEAPWLPGDGMVEAQVRVVHDAEEYLGTVADRLRGAGVTVETSVWYGEPAISIIDAASAQHAGLIVMTTHGRSGLGRLIMGSVAESVLRGTTTPILLLRADGAPVAPLEGTARRVEATRA
jgi:nucleotide-binding universal stress UspA family protein